MFISFLVSGGYSDWTQWSQCSATCGLGHKTRERSCNSPLPAHGGPTCIDQGHGEASETSDCNEGPCPSKYIPIYLLTYSIA